MSEIIVRGEAQARLTPTSATISVGIQALSPVSLAEAGQQAAQASNAVDEVVAGHRERLITAVATTSLTTGQRWEHHPTQGRRLAGYQAQRTITLSCRADGAALTALLADITPIPDTSVRGPSWRIAPDADGWDEVRAAAAADAAGRAAAYARGLGRDVGPVLWIAEPGLRIAGDDGAPAGGAMHRARFASAASAMAVEDGGEAALVLQVVVEDLEVSAAIEVGFGLG